MFEGIRKFLFQVVLLLLFITIIYVNILLKNKLNHIKKILVLLYLPYGGTENNEVLQTLQFLFCLANVLSGPKSMSICFGYVLTMSGDHF